MAERKFTLLELHLGDGHVQFGPKSISTGGEDETEDVLELGEESESGGRRLLPLVLGLLVLAGIAVAAKKLAGGGDLEELEELDELAADD